MAQLGAYQATITFGSTPVSVGAALIAAGMVGSGNQPSVFMRRLTIQPLRANTALAWINVGSPSTTPTVNATNYFKELAIPQAGTPLDIWDDAAAGSDHSIDVGVYYVQGTSGQGCVVGAFTI